MKEISIRDDFIKLGQAMKLSGLSQSGSEAKEEITGGNVLVNGEKEERRGRKLYKGDIISFKGEEIKII